MSTKETQTEFEWNDDTLHVDDNGHVDGQAWFGSFVVDGEEYDVTASVTSYDYTRYGEIKTNHVPHIVVSKINGRIVSEPHAHDKQNAEGAIEEAKSVARNVVEEPKSYIN